MHFSEQGRKRGLNINCQPLLTGEDRHRTWDRRQNVKPASLQSSGLMESKAVPELKHVHTWEDVTLIHSFLKDLCSNTTWWSVKGSITFTHLGLFWKLIVQLGQKFQRELKLRTTWCTDQQSPAYSARSVSKPNSSKQLLLVRYLY